MSEFLRDFDEDEDGDYFGEDEGELDENLQNEYMYYNDKFDAPKKKLDNPPENGDEMKAPEEGSSNMESSDGYNFYQITKKSKKKKKKPKKEPKAAAKKKSEHVKFIERPHLMSGRPTLKPKSFGEEYVVLPVYHRDDSFCKQKKSTGAKSRLKNVDFALRSNVKECEEFFFDELIVPDGLEFVFPKKNGTCCQKRMGTFLYYGSNDKRPEDDGLIIENFENENKGGELIVFTVSGEDVESVRVVHVWKPQKKSLKSGRRTPPTENCKIFCLNPSYYVFFFGSNDMWTLRKYDQKVSDGYGSGFAKNWKETTMSHWSFNRFECYQLYVSDSCFKEVKGYTAELFNGKLICFGGLAKDKYDESDYIATNQLFGIVSSSERPESIQSRKKGDERYKVSRKNRSYTDRHFGKLENQKNIGDYVFHGLVGHFMDDMFLEKKPRKNFYYHIISEYGPIPRSNHASCCVNDDYMFVYGGIDQKGNALDDLWGLSKHFKWEKFEHRYGLIPPPLTRCQMFSVGKTLFICGGVLRDGTRRKENIIYSIGNNDGLYQSWKVVSPLRRENLEENEGMANHSIFPMFNSIFMQNKDKLYVGRSTDSLLKSKKSELFGVYLRKMLKEGKCSDFKFIIKSSMTEILAHKCILYARLPFFRKLFSENRNLDSFEVDKFSHEVVEKYLEFVYCGNLIVQNQIVSLVVLDNTQKDKDTVEHLVNLSREWGFYEEINRIVTSDLDLKYVNSMYTKMKNDLLSLIFDENGVPHREEEAEKRFSDLKIECMGEEVFYGHKLLLTRSSFIDKCLHSGMIEEIEGRLLFRELSAKGLNEVLHYIYTNEIKSIDNETVVEIHLFSIIFKLEVLSNICRRIIIAFIGRENAVELLSVFYLYRDDAIVNRCLVVIDKNYDVFEEKKDILSKEIRDDIRVKRAKNIEVMIKRKSKSEMKRKRKIMLQKKREEEESTVCKHK